MSFVDKEAEEIDEDEEHSEVEDEIKKSKKKKKQKKINHFEEDDEEDDEEDEDEDEIDYEKTKAEFKDFIDDDVDESENEEKSDEKSSESEESELEGDDIELIKQNLDIDDTALEKVGIIKKRRRIKQQLESSSDEEAREPTPKALKKTKESAARAAAKESRKQHVNEHREAEVEEEVEAEEEVEEENQNRDEENLEDFIVDDSDDENGDGQARRPKRRVFNDEAQQEALDIFGVNAEELGAFDSDHEDGADEEDEYEGAYEDEEDEELLDDEDVEGQIAKVKKKQRRLKSKHKIEEIFEPAELERNYLTEFDQHICIEDEPERFMLRRVPVTSETNELELDKEAEWIYKQVFEQKLTITTDTLIEFTPKPASIIPRIRDTLKFMRNEFLEVPFIAFYRKEYITDLSINDLWKIYEYDEKYCQLKTRKDNLIKLLQRMQKYQFNKLREQHALDDTLSNLNLDDQEQQKRSRMLESIRTIEDSDIERVKNIQTNEEYFDLYKQYKLYYLCDVDDMREYEKQSNKKRQQRNNDENGEDADANLDVGDGDDQHDKEYKKTARRKDAYYYCKLGGLNSLAKKFGLSAEQFGENVVAEYHKHEVDQWSVEPNLTALDYLSEKFNNIDSVIAGARHILAMQIARDPNVKSVVRDLYFKRATITVKPTAKGLKEIDENHPCFPYKYLKQKPVISFKNDQYLKIHQAKKDSLIEVSFDPDSANAIIFANNESNKVAAQEEDYDAPVQNSQYHAIAQMPKQSIYEILKNYFQKDEFSFNVEQWNIQRGNVLNEVLYKILYPELEQELNSKLINEAKDHVLNGCKKKMREWLNVAPYNPEIQHFDDMDQTERGCRVFAISYSSDPNEVAICACVNGNGELDEFVRLRKLTLRDQRYTPQAGSVGGFANDRAEKQEDLQKLFKLILEKRPSVIVVGAENKDALSIIEELRAEIQKISKEKETGRVLVELIDNELAKLYASTKVAETEFRDQPALLKQSIALARHLQDPLLAFSQLCNPDADVLLLKYHPLQDLLTKDELLNAVEHEFIEMTNTVGVDLNRCVAHPHTSNVLQFVSGLGPRKAAHILKTAKYKMPIMNRTFLVTECTLGSKVFVNCAGFIKFDVDNLAKEVDDENDETRYTEVLDSTRIHPEAYEWARKMAVDALDLDDANDSSNSALKEILECPDRLKDLDLEAFAAELERTGAGYKLTTLYNIKEELYNRYEDKREPYRSAAAQETFHMLTKETPYTFYKGKLVLCRVTSIARKRPTKEELERAEPIKDESTCTWQCSFCKRGNFSELAQVWTHFDTDECPGRPSGVRVILDNQITGFVPLKLLSDNDVRNPEDRLKVGQIIYARIVKIDIDRFSVELTCRSSDLKDVDDKWRPTRDDFYDFDEEQMLLNKIEDKKRRDEHRQSFTKRVIAHPQFHNIGYKECIEMLKDMDIGDTVIRPSSKGIDHLTLTWKVTKDIYQHVDIIEEKKVNQFSLGKRLIIEGEEYEDLDEILARYVHPLSNYVREILNYKYYRDIDSTRLEVIENLLTTEQKQNPSRIPYMFVCDRTNPGRFLLSYVVRGKVRHEGVKITPDGFRLRQQVHKTFNNLINWFKKHYNDPISLSNTMSVGGSNSSRIGTPQNLAAQVAAGSASQRNATSSSPFVTPAVPPAYGTPRSWISTPSTSTMPTPNRPAGVAAATPSRTPNNAGASTPYSPTNAATPHLQHFPSANDNDTPMDHSGRDDNTFRKPSNNFGNNSYNGRNENFRGGRGGGGRGGRGGGGRGGRVGRGGFNNEYNNNRNNSWNNRDNNGGGFNRTRGNNRDNNFNNNNRSFNNKSNFSNSNNAEESWDDDPAPKTSQTSATTSNNNYRSSTNNFSTSNSNRDDDSWDDPAPSSSSSITVNKNVNTTTIKSSKSNDAESWDEDPVPAPTRTTALPSSTSYSYKSTASSVSNSARDDDNWDDEPVSKNTAPQPANISRNTPVRQPPPSTNQNRSDDESWDDPAPQPSNISRNTPIRQAPPPANQRRGDDDESWDDPAPQQPTNNLRNTPIRQAPPPVNQRRTDDESWDDAPSASRTPNRNTPSFNKNTRNDDWNDDPAPPPPSRPSNNFSKPPPVIQKPTPVSNSKDDEMWD